MPTCRIANHYDEGSAAIASRMDAAPGPDPVVHDHDTNNLANERFRVVNNIAHRRRVTITAAVFSAVGPPVPLTGGASGF